MLFPIPNAQERLRAVATLYQQEALMAGPWREMATRSAASESADRSGSLICRSLSSADLRSVQPFPATSAIRLALRTQNFPDGRGRSLVQPVTAPS
jgi:hypothetical protein